jgi:hypothetical protein
MPTLFGRYYTRREIEQRVGCMDQLAFIRPMVLDDGRGRGIRGFQVSTGGGLEFNVMADRCLDILDFRHNGRSLCWHSGVGPVSPAFYEAEGENFLRSFFGGMVTTCGLTNAGSPSEDEGKAYPLHGRIANTPAERIRWSADWEGDDYVLLIEGEVRETRVFGPRLVLKRRIRTTLGSLSVSIEDTVENEGFSEEPCLLLYHVNTGFPVLDEGSELRIDSQVTPLGDFATAGLNEWNRAIAPTHNIEEQCYVHDVITDAEGMAQAEIWNERIGLGFRVRYRKAELPHLWQWKMMCERDYVMGLEPVNCGPGGRAAARASGQVGILPPRGSISHRVVLEAFER